MRRSLTFIGLVAASWVVMTFVHECGHLLAGMLCGAQLVDFDLAPWRMPYSLHSHDPYPLLTLWAGPVIGVLIPMILAACLRRRWAWFIADFCLLANGVYLALAWLSGDHWLDTARLLQAGAYPITILLYCLITIGVGYQRFRSDCIDYLSSPSKPVTEANS